MAAKARRRPHRGKPELAPQHVDRDVDTLRRGRSDLVVEVRGVTELDDHIRAELFQASEALIRERGGNDSSRTEQLRRLDGDRADRAGRAENAHNLTGA